MNLFEKLKKLPWYVAVLSMVLFVFGTVIRYQNLFNLGFTFDMVATQYDWGKRGFEMGYFGFWKSYSGFFDYLPLSLLYEIAVYTLSLPFGGSAQVFVGLLKTTNWIVDIWLSAIVYREIKKSQRSDAWAIPLALMIYAVPVTWFISGVWGQNDTLIVIGSFFALRYLLASKYWQLAVVFTLTFWLKQQIILIIPTLLLVAVMQETVQSFRKPLLKMFSIFALMSGIITIPLLFLNHVRVGSATFAAFLREDKIGFGANSLWTLLDITGVGSQKVGLLSVTSWGYLLFFSFSVWVSWKIYQSQNLSMLNLSIFTALSTSAYFMFVTKMHSRYLHFGVIWSFLVFTYLIVERKKWQSWFVGMVIMYTGYILNQVGIYATTSIWGFDNPDPGWVRSVYSWIHVDVGRLAALCNVVGFFWLFVVGMRILYTQSPKKLHKELTI
jgi:dolichyl-phosphate-mannose-protein mannosyltransferase